MNLRNGWIEECRLLHEEIETAPTLRDVIIHNWTWWQNQTANPISADEAYRLYMHGMKILDLNGIEIHNHTQIHPDGIYYYPNQEPYQREN